MAIEFVEDIATQSFDFSLHSDYSFGTFPSSWETLNPFNNKPSNDMDDMPIRGEVNKLLANFKIYFFNKGTKGTESTPNLSIYSLPMTNPAGEYKYTDDMYGLIIPSMFTIGAIAVLFKFVLWIVSEKEKKLNHLLMRQGITNFQYVLSWLITYCILNIIPVIIMAIILNVFWFKNTNFFFVLLPCMLFFLNIFGMIILLVQFLNNVNQSQSLLKLVYVGISILDVPLSFETTSPVIRYIFSIFPQIVLKSTLELLWQVKVTFPFNF